MCYKYVRSTVLQTGFLILFQCLSPFENLTKMSFLKTKKIMAIYKCLKEMINYFESYLVLKDSKLALTVTD